MKVEFNNTKTALEVHDLTVAFDRKPVLWDIDMTIPQGKLVGISDPMVPASPRL